MHRGQEFFLRQRASCVSTQREANETNSVMVLRSSFSLTCARWASTVLGLSVKRFVVHRDNENQHILLQGTDVFDELDPVRSS